jgi:predicted transcriptional regulator
MRILWEHGEMKPGEIQQFYPEPIKNSALRSYLTILVEKGRASRRKVGKAYYYKAITRRESAFRKTLRDLVDAYFDGSTQALLLNLIRAEKLNDDDLLKLKRLANDRESPKTGRKRKHK